MPTLNQQAYGLVMAAFAQSGGASQENHVLVVEDNGGFHVPAPQGQPQGIEIVRLPPYAPERQPVERIWQLTDATLANTCPESLAALETVVGQQCAWLETQPDLITQHTLFHWWPVCQN
ncbi:hypothetical protein E7T06_11010 [Deinococcus sp. Arct2-2]|uniref:hypothetical protein n=1 Tax=Deinococcus sp. Arct2-2 TaxID=2568653 RepID=UPI0010A3BE33|nr:hypothetical protein [Deinococcus sp. Arct2-2]THF69663.1 hypothetical protein E7T06_11010 [Deinococcus sp. Arct2-2]